MCRFVSSIIAPRGGQVVVGGHLRTYALFFLLPFCVCFFSLADKIVTLSITAASLRFSPKDLCWYVLSAFSFGGFNGYILHAHLSDASLFLNELIKPQLWKQILISDLHYRLLFHHTRAEMYMIEVLRCWPAFLETSMACVCVCVDVHV